MTAERAAWLYRSAVSMAAHHDDTCPRRAQGLRCRGCAWWHLRIDAASLAYDLAVAEASRARVRAQVAYA